jgi:hypothetical protein
MKLIKTAKGKTQLSITKEEWERIGNEHGWMKEAKWGKDVKIEQPGKWEGYSLAELKKKRNAAKKRQEKRKEKGKKADPKDTELLRELNFAIRAKTDWGKAD